jgi:signal transduction histidine kinase
VNEAGLSGILHLLREDVGILDREGNLLWTNRTLATRLGLPEGSRESLPVVTWVATGSIPPLMRALIAVETGLMPEGERVSLSLTVRGTEDRPVRLIGSVQSLPGAEGLVLLLARRPRSSGSAGLLPSQADFLANMSHELKTPLNAVIGYSELLAMPGFTGSEEQRQRYAEDILDSGRDLLSLIEDILEFAKAGSGRMTIVLDEVDAKELLLACLKVAEGLVVSLGRPVTLVLATEGELGALRTDTRLLKQVVVNLLSNAVKFSRDGGRVELAARRAEGWLQVAVRDQGMGIEPEEAERVFSPFYQVDSSSRRQRGGMGLGLAIVSRFLDLLGGGIRLQSRPGVGSTFTFHVPLDGRAVPADASGLIDVGQLGSG